MGRARVVKLDDALIGITRLGFDTAPIPVTPADSPGLLAGLVTVATPLC
jgi:hypothetical protein